MPTEILKAFLILAFTLTHFLNPLRTVGQSAIAQQKEAVAFIFGTVHPINPDRTPKLDASGKPLALEMPLGTGFFVVEFDSRGGPGYGFTYLVTAKHVLRDFDGTFLRSVNVRVNLKSPEGDPHVDFIRDLPVSGADGKLLWYHGPNEADEAVAINCLPKQELVEYRAIPTSMFVDDATLKSSDVEEGDTIYFIGLMAQFYGAKKNYPVVRRGTLAMMTDEDVPSAVGPTKVFIAELQSWPGNSGSPVFLSLGGLRHGAIMTGENLRFLGILLGTFVNRIPATVVIGQQNEEAASVGVSLIVPAMQLKKILDSTEAQSVRDAAIQKFLKTPKSP